MGPNWAAHSWDPTAQRTWDPTVQPTWDPPLCEPGHQMGPNWAVHLPTGQPSWDPFGAQIHIEVGPKWAAHLSPTQLGPLLFIYVFFGPLYCSYAYSFGSLLWPPSYTIYLKLHIWFSLTS